MATWPKLVLTLGLYGLWRRRQTTILTNRRVLLNKGVIMHSERAIPIERIADAQFERKGLYAYTDLIIRDSRRIERIGPLSPRNARRLASEVLSYG
jgi:membrane protein YdbS with pleckstrin-like domain